jgi:RNA polymerase sigma-70 factor (ECF subfamily)
MASAIKAGLAPGVALVERASNEVPNEALLKAIAGGDRRAMHVLYARHHVRVYRFILRLAKDPSLAEDLVSEVFLDVWRKAGSFQGKAQVSTWLLAIARNKTLCALRSRRDAPLSDKVTATIADPADDAQTVAEKNDRGAIVRRCIAQLSVAHREVVDLAYYHEKSVEEIAHIVGAAVGTIKTRMYYARSRLALLLAAAGVDRGALVA